MSPPSTDTPAPPPRLTRAQRREQTRDALIAAAGRVFVRRGFQSSSVEEIAAEAGYSRGAFYSNFASKEELFVALLQDRAFSAYREMATDGLEHPERPASPRETGLHLAALQGGPDAQWMLRLLFEVLAHAGRDESFRELAATFWRGNRALTTELLRQVDPDPGTPHEQIAIALAAVDIGLSIQHYADPEGVPLELYPKVFELLFGPLYDAAARRRAGG